MSFQQRSIRRVGCENKIDKSSSKLLQICLMFTLLVVLSQSYTTSINETHNIKYAHAQHASEEKENNDVIVPDEEEADDIHTMPDQAIHPGLSASSSSNDNNKNKEDTNNNNNSSSVIPAPFVRPPSEGLHFFEDFQEKYEESRWVKRADEKYTGQITISKRIQEGIANDYGMKLNDAAHHHAISTTFPLIENNKNRDFVIQYEAKFEKDLHCGGAYLKLFYMPEGEEEEKKEKEKKKVSKKKKFLEKFDGFTDYVIMFGPDKCGPTNRVHFILKHLNPVTNLWTEHHYRDSPSVPDELVSHVYTLWIKPDNTFQIIIDMQHVSHGDLYKDMIPPIIPPKKINDPNDVKPDDWVDEEKIVDPNFKEEEEEPEEPQFIPDPNAKMPHGWLENEPLRIPDPNAKKPENWDDEEDGVWSPPLIDNEKCAAAPGCGKWTPNLIKNKKYKQKKKNKSNPPLIDNPNYKGPWKPRQIDNPDYFFDDALHALNKINCVGYELWTMQSGIIFDNLLISRDYQKAFDVAKHTWLVRVEKEREWQRVVLDRNNEKNKMMNGDENSFLQNIISSIKSLYYNNNPLHIIPLSLLGLIMIIFCRRLVRKSFCPAPPHAFSSTEGKKKNKKEKNSETNSEIDGAEEEEEEEEGASDENTDEEEEEEEEKVKGKEKEEEKEKEKETKEEEEEENKENNEVNKKLEKEYEKKEDNLRQRKKIVK